jgi:hypothetical protein
LPCTIEGPVAFGSAATEGVVRSGASSGGGSGVDAQPASIPTIASHAKDLDMLIILLEAFAALCALLFIVWWTMFSGRKKGEPPREDDDTTR